MHSIIMSSVCFEYIEDDLYLRKKPMNLRFQIMLQGFNFEMIYMLVMSLHEKVRFSNVSFLYTESKHLREHIQYLALMKIENASRQGIW